MCDIWGCASGWLDLHLFRRCGAPCATTEPQRRVPIHSTTQCICYRNSHGRGYERIVPRAAPYEISKAIAWFAVRIPASRSAGRTHGPISTFSFAFVHSVKVPSSGAGDPPPPPLPPIISAGRQPPYIRSLDHTGLTSGRGASLMLVIGWCFTCFPHGPRFSPLVLRNGGLMENIDTYTSDLCVFQVSIRSGKQRLKGGRHGSRRFVWGIGRVGKLIIEKRRGFG
jgi:hypothetical protein